MINCLICNKMGTETVDIMPEGGTVFVTPNAAYVPGTLVPCPNSVLLTGLIKYPHRLMYPKNSMDNNPNAPTGKTITTSMWWHK